MKEKTMASANARLSLEDYNTSPTTELWYHTTTYFLWLQMVKLRGR
jgi:hypothetical protein